MLIEVYRTTRELREEDWHNRSGAPLWSRRRWRAMRNDPTERPFPLDYATMLRIELAWRFGKRAIGAIAGRCGRLAGVTSEEMIDNAAGDLYSDEERQRRLGEFMREAAGG